jgi:pimeloyl-ACP methyl ester carboxylesterase
VILESGLGSSSLGWVNIQPQIAKFTRVCSYDRAGYGGSEIGKEPRTNSRIGGELKALMDTAGEYGPYILVVASFGGFIVRVFSGLYPAAVDASHEDQQERVDRILPSAAREERDKEEAHQRRREQLNQIVGPIMVRLGIERLQAALRPLDPAPPPFGLTRALVEETDYLERKWETRQTVAAESAGMKESAKETRSGGGMGDRPLIVLTGARMEFRPDPLMTRDKEDQLRNLWIDNLQAGLAGCRRKGGKSF